MTREEKMKEILKLVCAMSKEEVDAVIDHAEALKAARNQELCQVPRQSNPA